MGTYYLDLLISMWKWDAWNQQKLILWLLLVLLSNKAFVSDLESGVHMHSWKLLQAILAQVKWNLRPFAVIHIKFPIVWSNIYPQ